MAKQDAIKVPEKKSKVGLILNIVSIVVAVIAVIMMVTVMFTTQSAKENGKPIFGTYSMIVLSDSMSVSDEPDGETFKVNDLIFAKEVSDFSKIKKGDIITYQSRKLESMGQRVTHKVLSVRKEQLENGSYYYVFTTYGTTNGWSRPDGTIDPAKTENVAQDHILGVYTGKIAGVGTVLNFLRKPLGYAICVGLPFVAIMVMQAINTIRLVGSYRKSKTDDKVKAMDDENALLKAQLEALQAQMMAQQSPSPAGEGGPLAVDEVQSQVGEGEPLAVDEVQSDPPIVEETTVVEQITEQDPANKE
jgi:signal peptidase I